MAPSVASFADLLQSAVTEPGTISNAYRQFHTYSLGNQLLAWSQCLTREIQPGPIATFMGWKDKGRHVRKGEKAITLPERSAQRVLKVADQILKAGTTAAATDDAEAQS